MKVFVGGAGGAGVGTNLTLSTSRSVALAALTSTLQSKIGSGAVHHAGAVIWHVGVVGGVRGREASDTGSAGGSALLAWAGAVAGDLHEEVRGDIRAVVGELGRESGRLGEIGCSRCEGED